MNQTDTEQEEENIPETAKTIQKNAKKDLTCFKICVNICLVDEGNTS